jgi:hypothetical protein
MAGWRLGQRAPEYRSVDGVIHAVATCRAGKPCAATQFWDDQCRVRTGIPASGTNSGWLSNLQEKKGPQKGGQSRDSLRFKEPGWM